MMEKIEKFFEYLTTITKEEADFIEYILSLNEEDRYAFMFAKSRIDKYLQDTEKQ